MSSAYLPTCWLSLLGGDGDLLIFCFYFITTYRLHCQWRYAYALSKISSYFKPLSSSTYIIHVPNYAPWMKSFWETTELRCQLLTTDRTATHFNTLSLRFASFDTNNTWSVVMQTSELWWFWQSPRWKFLSTPSLHALSQVSSDWLFRSKMDGAPPVVQSSLMTSRKLSVSGCVLLPCMRSILFWFGCEGFEWLALYGCTRLHGYAEVCWEAGGALN